MKLRDAKQLKADERDNLTIIIILIITVLIIIMVDNIIVPHERVAMLQ